MEADNDDVRLITQAVLSSPKYRHVCETFVADVARRELAKRRNLKETIKATKNKLHQVAGAYIIGKQDYDAWLPQLREAHDSDASGDFLRACKRIMMGHASTRERVPVLDQFYTTIFADLPPVRSILDIACGLNPLAIPWMPLASEAQYYAYDIYEDTMRFLGLFLEIVGVHGQAIASDVLLGAPTQAVDVALILKAIPCLEQIDKGAGYRLLETIQAQRIVVSFPVRSLGGRNRGMLENYEAHFLEWARGKNWRIQRFEFPTELVFSIYPGVGSRE